MKLYFVLSDNFLFPEHRFRSDSSSGTTSLQLGSDSKEKESRRETSPRANSSKSRSIECRNRVWRNDKSDSRNRHSVFVGRNCRRPRFRIRRQSFPTNGFAFRTNRNSGRYSAGITSEKTVWKSTKLSQTFPMSLSPFFKGNWRILCRTCSGDDKQVNRYFWHSNKTRHKICHKKLEIQILTQSKNFPYPQRDVYLMLSIFFYMFWKRTIFRL